jgi:NTP pyrophosphatase (non-canonical NTP hydrolase)
MEFINGELMKEHKKLVFELAKPGQDIVDELTPMQAFALHMAIGVSGEAGELLDTIKKFAIYQKPLDFTNLVEELGDIEFYLEGIRQAFSLDRNDILEANIVKLRKRYGDKYSNLAAQVRADK